MAVKKLYLILWNEKGIVSSRVLDTILKTRWLAVVVQ